MEEFFNKHIMGLFSLMFIINTIWMVVIDQDSMAIGSIITSGVFALLYKYQLEDKD
jgi:hypothetical protein